jgi:hypothetical protein
MADVRWSGRDFAERIALLESQLRSVSKLQALSDSDHDEVVTVAHGLLDIEEATNAFSELVGRAVELDTMTEDQIDAWLADIGEELRHILYHIGDMRYYEYLRI